MTNNMIDVQAQTDDRHITIDKVGVKNIRYPVTVLDKSNKTQQTVASVNMYVNLPHHFKGTHMSRFIEILNEHKGEINIKRIPNILKTMQKRLEAMSAHLEVDFPYFIKKKSPVTQTPGLMEYRCRLIGSINHGHKLKMEVFVPITTVCPCSKEISEYGAHNQRGEVKVAIRFKNFIWIEDIIELVESCGSSPLYSILKRPDEKYITETAYENPKFVEDIVRDIASKLQEDDNILWFSVASENFESIHNHSAYAFIERDKKVEINF